MLNFEKGERFTLPLRLWAPRHCACRVISFLCILCIARILEVIRFCTSFAVPLPGPRAYTDAALPACVDLVRFPPASRASGSKHLRVP
jgi:hypothetical protein